MSKKASVNKPKKSRRRLKRSVRRSLAALLMITAIGVAAVPVPENFAEGETTPPVGTDPSNPGGTVSDVTDVHDKYDDKKNLLPVFSESSITDETSEDVLVKGLDLGKYKDAGTDTLIAAMKSTTEADRVYGSMAIVSTSGGYDLSWQFLYYIRKDPISRVNRGVVCRYNSSYPEDTVELSMTPITKYKTLEQQSVMDWYDGKEVSGMDAYWKPNEKITYSYIDWYDGKKFAADSNQLYFINNYDKQTYDDKIIDFENYKKEHPDRPATGDVVPAPYEESPTNKLKKSTTDVSDLMLAYFSHYDTSFSNRPGYSWVKVTDSRLESTDTTSGSTTGGSTTGGTTSSGTSKHVFVAQHESKQAVAGERDRYGFMIASEEGSALPMCAIGDKAFKEAGNVKQLVIPDDIGYIGDEAFQNATLVTSVKIGNIRQLGNRAFKGCSHLESIEFESGTRVIGAECFRGTAIKQITLPDTVTVIGDAAFAGNDQLTTVNISACKGYDSTGCTVKNYVFYNCRALQNIVMTGSSGKIIAIGDGTFGVDYGGVEMDIVLPDETLKLGEFLFSGRTTLKSVVFPHAYGTGNKSNSVTIPDNIFHGCSNLGHIEFPVSKDPYGGGWVKYDSKKLFADVVNPNLYVRGPELKNSTQIADPRECTWSAETEINDFVPYVFKKGGVDCYEVAMDGYRYQANQNGELTSCVLVGATDGNLVIPSKVGNYPISKIVDGCFGKGPNYTKDEEDLRNSIKTITIEDNSISSIDAGVFRDLENLTKVTIGNSVTSIGASAFEGCKKLTDVTFHSPLNGPASFPVANIGTNAFATGSVNLTFNGDISDSYGPYKWAMAPNNKLDEDSGIRVCYRSLAPSYLTVIYDPNTKLRTLIDYPKFDQVDELLEEIHAGEYTKYGYTTYAAYRQAVSYQAAEGPGYDENRRVFREAWEAACDVGTNEAKNSVYNSDAYGPWVNTHFVDNYSTGSNSGVAGSGSGESGESGGESGGGGGENGGESSKAPTIGDRLVSFLFDPIVVKAAETTPPTTISDTPEAYYTHFPYSAEDNYDNGRGNTEEEGRLIRAATELVIPDGVDSIDVYAYRNGVKGSSNDQSALGENRNNINQYLTYAKIGSESYNMYLDKNSDSVDTVSGLFSGYYNDKRPETLENNKWGNDRITSITMNSVTYLPDYAFDSCENLSLVVLGDKCSNIGIAPFRGCTSLQTIRANPEYYVCENGIIYGKLSDGTYRIEECLAGRGIVVGGPNISIGDGDDMIAQVSAIQDGAFEGCPGIASVDLDSAKNLKVIPERCFKDCNMLNTVNLPDSVNEIKADAFARDNTNSLTVYIPGREVQIATDAFKPRGSHITIWTYNDTSAYRYGKYYDLTVKVMGDVWPVTFFDMDGTILGETTVNNNESLAGDQIPPDPQREGLKFTGWSGSMGSEKITTGTRITGRANFFAQYESLEGMVNGKYVVEFYTPFGDQVGDTVYVEPGGSVTPPDSTKVPYYEGYTFTGDWLPSTFTDIRKATTYMAQYRPVEGNGGSSSGGSTNTSGSSTNNNNNNSNNTSSNSTSTSATSTSSSAVGKYTVTVVNGSGSGTYDVGSTVIIAANTPASGKVFSKWTTDSSGVTLASVSMTATTFVMPANNVTVTANYIDGIASNTVGGTVNNNGSTVGRNPAAAGNTSITITKPGISNKDLATANVNGSSDNFVVKISETDEATQAVINALTNRYGNMDSILYYAMDISLYDSTGTVKIADTTGLSVDITIPIPDALTVFGGNNMAGAVSGGQLEDLSERFTTINGVPCISFTATHFSPYTIYVNTQNLSEGMLDVTPKTGDPIHPKWFLSLGLACLSIILFMKKDKRPVKVKAA